MERPTLDLEDMRTFVAVVQEGSFARAGMQIGISKSIVSRRIARLERKLGASLLVRASRGTLPTEIGQNYYQRLREIFLELEIAGEMVSASAEKVAGSIKLTAPVALGAFPLAAFLSEFMKVNPDVEIDLVLDDRTVDMIGERFDLAIRIGNLKDSSLVARRLGTIDAQVVASPAYLAEHGRPQHPDELAGHNLLFYANIDPGSEWSFEINGRWKRVKRVSRVRVNNGEALCQMAVSGLGIAMLPDFISAPRVMAGELECLLQEWSLPHPGLFAVMPPERAPLARVRALVEHLSRKFARLAE